MVTYFLGEEEVNAYLFDALNRLQRFDPFPEIWCPVTHSGTSLGKRVEKLLISHFPHLIDKISVNPIVVDNGAVSFSQTRTDDEFKGKRAFVFDGAIHSGGSMVAACNELLKHGVTDICSYALMIKRGSAFIPTMWGVMLNDEDRGYYLLPSIPNQRLDSGPSAWREGGRRPQCVSISRLDEEHLQMSPVVCGVASLDRPTWGDRHFSIVVGENRCCTYILQLGKEIVGYVTVHSDTNHLSVDEIAVDNKHKGKKHGSILLRFAENLARHSGYGTVRLYGIKEQIRFYEDFDYRVIPGLRPIALGEEEYWPMEHRILYKDPHE